MKTRFKANCYRLMSQTFSA